MRQAGSFVWCVGIASDKNSRQTTRIQRSDAYLWPEVKSFVKWHLQPRRVMTVYLTLPYTCANTSNMHHEPRWACTGPALHVGGDECCIYDQSLINQPAIGARSNRLIDWVEFWRPVSTLAIIWDAHVKGPAHHRMPELQPVMARHLVRSEICHDWMVTVPWLDADPLTILLVL